MEKLTTLSQDKLRKIYHELNEFFYKKANTNIAIERALKKQEYSEFRTRVEKALKKQILPFTKESNIETIIRKVNKLDDRKLQLTIATLFIVFSDALSGGQKTLLTYLVWAGELGGKDALAKMGANNLDFSIIDPDLVDSIAQRADFIVDQVDATTMAWIGKIISDSITSGFDASEIATIIKTNYPDMILRRSDVIAETELMNMFNAIQLETFKKNGAKQKKWVTNEDEKTCEICNGNSADGYIDLNEVFSSGHKHPLAHPGCFDKETEVLTSGGWVYFKELHGHEKVLSVDLSCGDADYVNIKKLFKYTSENIINYEGKVFNLSVSPEHNHVVKFPVKKKGKGRKDAGYWKIVTDKELPTTSFSFLSTIPDWKGKKDSFLGFTGERLDLFSEFLGYYLSEGNISKPKKGVWQIKISQNKDRYYEQMAECSEKLFKKIWRGEKAFYIPFYDNDILVDFFRSLGKSHDKYIPKEFKQLDKKYLRIFLDAFARGDGSNIIAKKWKGGNFKDRKIFYTSSEMLASDIGEVLLKVGKRPSYIKDNTKGKKHKFSNGVYIINQDSWTIYELNNTSQDRNYIERTIAPYNDYVYDIELEKNHTLFVRRKGKVTLSGNCRCYLITKSKVQDKIWRG